MKIFSTRNHNEVGVERVNRDGGVEVVNDDKVEVSVDDRMKWYNNVKLDEEREIETETNEQSNSMRRDEKMRTSLPRKEEFSTERRLEEERKPGSTTSFTSEATKEQAMGKAFSMVSPIIMAGNTLTPKMAASISIATGVCVEDIVSLEEIAVSNPDLAKIYASEDIPGLSVQEGGQLVKESDPKEIDSDSSSDDEEMSEEELAGFGEACGLCD